MSKFQELFDELCRTNDRSIIWNNWLDYCININLMQTKSKYAPKDFYGNEETYFEMFKEWIIELNHELKEKPYHDLIGHLYEDNVQSKGKAKDFQQYFTPQHVTELMSDLCVNDGEVIPGTFASDPCCGSGRLLLAAHCDSQGKLFCIGQDLDETSCKMSVLNFYSHGVRGSVLHMNSLTMEFYKGWRVNRWLLHGVPVPHIEEISNEWEAFNFIGVKDNADNKCENNNAPRDYQINDSNISGNVEMKTKQSTLL